jgi:HECT-like ubiquitin-transferase
MNSKKSTNPIGRTYQPAPGPHDQNSLDHFEFFGRVFALALNNGHLMELRLTMPFWKEQQHTASAKAKEL